MASRPPPQSSMLRMPPPSSTFRPDCSATACARWRRSPDCRSLAPSKSTMCIHRAPAAAKARAAATGSSATWWTVSKSPCFRRTHRPSFRSMAGKRIIGSAPPKFFRICSPVVPALLRVELAAEHIAAAAPRPAPAPRSRWPAMTFSCRAARPQKEWTKYDVRALVQTPVNSGQGFGKVSYSSRCGAASGRVWMRSTRPGIRPRPAVSPHLVAPVEQQLHSQADAQHGLAWPACSFSTWPPARCCCSFSAASGNAPTPGRMMPSARSSTSGRLVGDSALQPDIRPWRW